MVPSPYVTNNHQEKNARLLEKHGGAVVITEPESTGDGLYKAVEAILSDNEKRISIMCPPFPVHPTAMPLYERTGKRGDSLTSAPAP